jgi:hypothetical protein
LTGAQALAFAFGLALCLAGAHLLLNGRQLRRRGRHTHGRVTRLSQASALICFRTAAGEEVSVPTRRGLPDGSPVALYYDPAAPRHIAVDDQLYRWGPYALLILGLTLMPCAWLVV